MNTKLTKGVRCYSEQDHFITVIISDLKKLRYRLIYIYDVFHCARIIGTGN